MKCERCGVAPKGKYELHDYCAECSKNLCAACFETGRCLGGRKHIPANHGGSDE